MFIFRGMFWDTFADDSSTLKGVGPVLQRESFSLEDLLREDDVLSEFGASNALVSYVVKNVGRVIELALMSPKTEEEHRFTFFSTELLRFGHVSVSDAVVTHLSLLMDFIRGVEEGRLQPGPGENLSRILIKLFETGKLLPREVAVDPLLRHLYNGSVLNVVSALIFACTKEFETVRGVNSRLVRQLDPALAAWLADERLPERLCRLLFVERSDMREHAEEALERLILFAQLDDAVSIQLCASSPIFEADNDNVIEAAQGAELLISKYPQMAGVNQFFFFFFPFFNSKKKQVVEFVSCCCLQCESGRWRFIEATSCCRQVVACPKLNDFFSKRCFVAFVCRSHAFERTSHSLCNCGD
jgi:hypothetical protein